MKTFHSCKNIADWGLAFNGPIDKGIPCVAICCEPLGKPPGVMLQGTPEKIVQNLIELRRGLLANESVINECKNHCCEYRYGQYEIRDKIASVNMSAYPSPCQCACIYCHLVDDPYWVANTDLANKEFELMFEVIRYLDDNDYIDQDAWWQVASGEITVHPYREKFLNTVKDKRVRFLTNGFIFDEGIAKILRNNSLASINISMDSGTAETWAEVKSYDNYREVIGNLMRYKNQRPLDNPPITFKYIVLPGINDNVRDFYGIANLMKIHEADHLEISRDFKDKYAGADTTKLLKGVATLKGVLHEFGFVSSLSGVFSPEEIEQIDSIGV